MTERLRDRADAGRRLAAALKIYARRPDAIVLAIPRGGVPVAFEIARELGLALDVIIVRKLGAPGHEELAMGAVASGGARVINPRVVGALHIGEAALERATAGAFREIDRRERAYRGGRPAPVVRGRTVILVDDGLATGSTVLAAVSALRTLGASNVVVACGVGASETCALVARTADGCVCAVQPGDLVTVSQWFTHFEQTEDDEVRALLQRASEGEASRT